MLSQSHIDAIIGRGVGSVLPPPKESLSQWCERAAYLSAETSATPGKWHAYPYQVGIMDAITDPAVEQVTVMKSARVGWTKILTFAVGYYIVSDPCPILLVQPTVEDAQGYSKDELTPMLRDVPELQGLVHDAGGRDGSNTILKKLFPGGQVMLTGANSARGFRRVSARVVIFDEVDGYPPEGAGQEGDQIALGKMRSDTFWNRKILIGSTPLIRDVSRVEMYYQESDQRHYYVPCIHCGHMHVLEWSNLRWPKGDPSKAEFQCPRCSRLIPHGRKRDIVSAGEWRADRPFVGHAGFHIWAAYSYSPNATWGKLAAEWSDIIHARNKPRQQTFTNTVLGETWEETGDTVEPDGLLSRLEPYTVENIPAEVLLLTCGTDIHPDRIEAELVGWGLGTESWSCDYRIFRGDTSRPEVWEIYDMWLRERFRTEDGRILPISGTCIDMGDQTQTVYDFVYEREKERRNVWACRGVPGTGKPIATPPTRSGTRKVKLVTVGTFAAKELLYGQLAVDTPGPNYCHFPAGRESRYFTQLTGERKIHPFRKGVQRVEWVKKTKGSRNEALDCRVYAMAAFEVLRPDLRSLANNVDVLRERQKKRVAEMEAAMVDQTQTSPDQVVQAIRKRQQSRRPGRSSFATKW